MKKTYKGGYFKRFFQQDDWLIVIALEEPDSSSQYIECKVLYSRSSNHVVGEHVELFYFKLDLITEEEEAMLEML